MSLVKITISIKRIISPIESSIENCFIEIYVRLRQRKSQTLPDEMLKFAIRLT